ncbi:hypothetical protein CXB51_031127 [Gossypium anomalum]|uniref:Uncharacterized protein n=1 Tax=Gossypium anomalum TaxID=47600 RepID=A0A8J6CPD6_9ROSI|nr:hypothetical protein CXB51_031127 [Gossypium anomalum]
MPHNGCRPPKKRLLLLWMLYFASTYKKPSRNNTMRRALLGELEGTCITRAKSEKIPHE